MTTPTHAAEAAALDPLPFLKALLNLRQAIGMYPAAHPMITHQLSELGRLVRVLMESEPDVHIDIINGHVHLNGASFHDDGPAHARILNELLELQLDSIHIRAGVGLDEFRTVADVLSHLKDVAGDEPLERRLERQNVRHISLGRIVPLDTRWRVRQWPDAPTGSVDPAYAEALIRTEQTFDAVTSGHAIDAVSVRDLVSFLIHKVARSNVALSQILALKTYENLTYCHSVNVAVLSLLLGAQIQLDEATLSALVEAALLHDIGKTKIPLDIVKKPGALDRTERKLIESHTIRGAELLADTDGLHPLTATVALEHHRSVTGGGYPDLGSGVLPHPMSQIVSVADVYEALTGARSYQDPRSPDQACLVLARKAGDALNTALVKAFVAAVTFFPLGTLVRTNKGETGVVVRTHPDDPLHPVIVLADGSFPANARVDIDTSARGESGEYERHIVTTVSPPAGFDLASYLAPHADRALRRAEHDTRVSVH